MKFNILDLLLPREKKFYDLLSKQSENLLEAAREFHRFLDALAQAKGDESLRSLVRIKELEKVGDKLERSIIDELDATFITPIDREDIHKLATEVETALDLINNLSRKFETYDIREIPSSLLSFSDLVTGIAGELVRLMGALQTRKDALSVIRVMHEYEKRADELFHLAVGELFKGEKSPIHIIKFKEIYELLEQVTNTVDQVGKLVRGILVKLG